MTTDRWATPAQQELVVTSWVLAASAGGLVCFFFFILTLPHKVANHNACKVSIYFTKSQVPKINKCIEMRDVMHTDLSEQEFRATLEKWNLGLHFPFQ